MAKRTKRLERGIKSLKDEIEKHFNKLERDISEGNIDRGRYHIKEIDKSLLATLEIKLKILGITSDSSIATYREELDKLKKILNLEN